LVTLSHSAVICFGFRCFKFSRTHSLTFFLSRRGTTGCNRLALTVFCVLCSLCSEQSSRQFKGYGTLLLVLASSFLPAPSVDSCGVVLTKMFYTKYVFRRAPGATYTRARAHTPCFINQTTSAFSMCAFSMTPPPQEIVKSVSINHL